MNQEQPSNSATSQPTAEEIAAVAYQFYVDSGRQDGYAEEHWARAEALIREKQQQLGASNSSAERQQTSDPSALLEKAREDTRGDTGRAPAASSRVEPNTQKKGKSQKAR